MTLPAPSRAERHERDLAERFADIDLEIEALGAALAGVNDAALRDRIEPLLTLGGELVAAHGERPGPDVADALVGVLSAVRKLRVPARDADLGATPTLRELRAVQGRLVLTIEEALELLQALGLRPRDVPLAQELALDVPRAGNESLLRAIERRLTAVVDRLDALDAARAEPTNFVQQTGLLNFYLGAMRVEIDIARMQLRVGEDTIDFAALTRAAEAMTDLTLDFVATVRAWVGRVSDAVRTGAEGARGSVRKVAAGVRTATKWMTRRARRRPVAPESAPLGTPPPEFDLAEVKRRILAGQAVPGVWIDYVTELNFMDEPLADVAPLAALTNLQSLDLGSTQVSDVAPLAALTNLQSLYLEGTQVSDVAPLAALTNLHTLYLWGTRVSDVAPLAALTNLQSLYLRGTQVSDVAPLAALTNLQSLHLGGTQVSDVAPLAALTNLQSLHLGGTQVSDVAPLAALTNLQSLHLGGTRVSDVAPLAALTKLQSLDLDGTRVSDVAPLAALINLQSLYLGGTQVSDVAPLAALTNLQSLHLGGTQVSDVAPLAALTNLQRLYVAGAPVRDIAVLGHLRELRIDGGPGGGPGLLRRAAARLFRSKPVPR